MLFEVSRSLILEIDLGERDRGRLLELLCDGEPERAIQARRDSAPTRLAWISTDLMCLTDADDFAMARNLQVHQCGATVPQTRDVDDLKRFLL